MTLGAGLQWSRWEAERVVVGGKRGRLDAELRRALEAIEQARTTSALRKEVVDTARMAAGMQVGSRAGLGTGGAKRGNMQQEDTARRAAVVQVGG